MRYPYFLLFVLVSCIAASTSAVADTFRYKDGRVITGTVRNESSVKSGEDQVKAYVVEIEPGVMVQVLQNELEYNGHERLSEPRQAYVSNVGNMEQTVEQHFLAAGECLKHGLTDLAQAHYRRVLDLDPDNNRARDAAGYDKDRNGRWVKKDVVMGDRRGKVLYKGRWRFPESVAIEQSKEEAKQKLAEATKDLIRWHRAALAGTGRRYEEAIQGLQTINDPLTASTIADFLLDTRKPAPLNLRLLYVRLLAKFQTYDAARGLAQASMLDPQSQVRNACFDALSNFGREVAIPLYISYLASDSNQLVNIAADGLGQLRADSAVLPLINALTTTHSTTVGSDATNASPTSGSFSVGGKKTIQVPVQNQSVLGTLAQLTGEHYGFDQERWMAWYARTYAPPAGSLKRDP